MLVSEQIEKLIYSLHALNSSENYNEEKVQAEFQSILDEAIKLNSDRSSPASLDSERSKNNWVDGTYSFDVENPRKPNMRELMEAMSGRTVEELYADPNSEWESLSKNANEILYGVLGKNVDTRDWNKIMGSDDIVASAQSETGKMFEPFVDIVNKTDTEGRLIDQYAAIKDSKGSILRSLKGDEEAVQETLRNFGAAKDSIPSDIETKISINTFDSQILNGLKKHLDVTSQISNEADRFNLIDLSLQSTLARLENQYFKEIPTEELEKL